MNDSSGMRAAQEGPKCSENDHQVGIALVCPTSRKPLERVSIEEAKDILRAPLKPVRRLGSTSASVGATPEVLLCRSTRSAYPIIDDIPVLLAPERLEAEANSVVDVATERYAEAYAEMDFYNSFPVQDQLELTFLRSLEDGDASFPNDRAWIDAVYDGPSQWECYKHLGSQSGKVSMQLGGSGFHALKFLQGGAKHAVLVTPMISEARRAIWLAEELGLRSRLTVTLGLAEEIPLATDSADGIFSGGCAHHMVMRLAMPEVDRVLTSGGRFAAAEPWRAPMYKWGTKVLGKREPNAHCYPFEAGRLEPFFQQFVTAECIHFGAITRYGLIALSKFGMAPSAERVYSILARDDRISDLLGVRRFGSSVALLSTAN